MKIITSGETDGYEILLERGLLNDCGRLLSERMPDPSGKKVCIVTDKNIETLYLEKVGGSFRSAGFHIFRFIIDGGEISKTMETATSLIQFLAEMKFGQGDVIAALGGGIVQDLSGFAASVYLGGIGYVQLPTSLVAAVDSTITDKVSINIYEGKNMAGLHARPILSVADPDCFATLPSSEYAQGLAEIIKCGVIADRFVFEMLEIGSYDIDEVTAKAIAIKARLSASEEGRVLLNFGRTIGKMAERAGAGEISRGESLGIGMYAEAASFGDKRITDRIYRTLAINGIPWKCSIPAEELLAQIVLDRNIENGRLKLVHPLSIGRCRVEEMTPEEAKKIFILGLS